MPEPANTVRFTSGPLRPARGVAPTTRQRPGTLASMSNRTYRFALSGYITVDEETVKRALIGMGIRQWPGDPLVTDEQQFDAKFQMAQSVDTLPLPQLLQSYLVNGYLAPYHQVLRNSVQEDMPDADVTFTGIDVEVVPTTS